MHCSSPPRTQQPAVSPRGTARLQLPADCPRAVWASTRLLYSELQTRGVTASLRPCPLLQKVQKPRLVSLLDSRVGGGGRLRDVGGRVGFEPGPGGRSAAPRSQPRSREPRLCPPHPGAGRPRSRGARSGSGVASARPPVPPALVPGSTAYFLVGVRTFPAWGHLCLSTQCF